MISVAVEFQEEFLEKGIEYLRPLTLEDVAQKIGRHESTSSRAADHKYVETPQGVLPVKFFFGAAIGEVGNQAVKHEIAG